MGGGGGLFCSNTCWWEGKLNSRAISILSILPYNIPYCGHYIMGLPSRGKHKGLRTKESVNDITCL